MMSNNKNTAIGLDRSKVLAYQIDNYSTPDKWFHMGYELEYSFNVHFSEVIGEKDRTRFINELLEVFHNVFGLMDDDHYQLGVPVDNPSQYILKVFWDKGSFNLQILNSLEDEINRIAILNSVYVELYSLIIIPRSREKMVLKIQRRL